MLIQLKQKDIKPLKEKIWLENNKKCPVLNKEVPLEKMVLDHIHKRKDEEASEQKGTCRTALEFRVNSMFGKIENSFKRYGLDKEIDLPTLLRNGANYLEKGAYCDNNTYFIHPNEAPKEKKLGKRSFNKIKKLYSKEYPNRKELEYPKSSKCTKLIKELSEKYKVEL